MNQTKRFKQFAIGISFAIALSLTACSSDANTNSTPPPATEMPSEQPNNNATPEPSAEPSLEPSKEPEQSGDNHGDSAESGSEVGELIGSIYDLAKEGKVEGSDYAAHDALFDEIEKAWGKPDSNESAGKGIYATYKDKGVTFGYNKGMVVFDVRSYSPKLKQISLKDLEVALGTSEEKTVSGSDTIYTYEVNQQYQLKFAITKSSGKVDHISVYSEGDTKNNMAG
ncbi:hypothetical protein FHS16_000195 [Paenibacillus endophyticus]|uniref:DUF4309 domain-containing protein n=1 Tax=Paenibacillus endophyticus TaxID=1294268 RepID=A0A7W5C361_9BACL|nr:DUF4309 domain-containing protein [Paenibacillus endophyticus]MBB3150163.1 hypothetical protein [Paenibacillus endophyticus]